MAERAIAVSGNPTLLKAVLLARRWRTHGTFVREYKQAAARISETPCVPPSREQYERWLAGKVKSAPYAIHCRVLEAMFPEFTADDLFRPPPPSSAGVRPAIQSQAVSDPVDAAEDPVKRRALLQLLSASAASAALPAITDSVEPLRRGLNSLLSIVPSERDADEWEQLTAVLGAEAARLPANLLLPQLLSELDELRGFVDEDGERTFALNKIMVVPGRRRQGVARAVHDALLGSRTERRATLLVDADNEPAATAYGHWGWRAVARLHPFPDAPVYTALIIDLPLSLP